jgi:hypothetical protein
LVFEYQCRFLLAEAHPDCPECKGLAQSLEKSEEGGLIDTILGIFMVI